METPTRRERREKQSSGGDRAGTSGPFWVRALQIIGLSAFAFAQPIFDLLGRQATFFVAHDAGPAQIVLFTVLLLVVPPAILIALEGVLELASRTVGQIAHIVIIGLLAGITLAPPVVDALGTGLAVSLVLLVALGGGVAFAYLRVSGVRSAATWLIVAPFAFGGLFLFASPVNELVFPDDAVAYASEAEQTPPVVWMTFDELPLASLLDADGNIDAARYPNFARLADTSTWYPNATAVAAFTPDAIPAMVSGDLPADQYEDPPTASFHPDTIFSMLAGTYDLTSYEVLTDLCSEEYCEQPVDARPSYSFGTLMKDTGTVFLHHALPEDAADEWLPTLEGRWAGFGNDNEAEAPAESTTDASTTTTVDGREATTGTGSSSEPVVDLDRAVEGVFTAQERLDSFLEGLGPTTEPSLWFFHANLPHEPWTYLPDGRRYNDIGLLANQGDARIWDDDELLVRQARQRHQLQLQYADNQLGQVLDRLDETGMLDETLMVVTADHGLELRAGMWRRNMSPYFANQAGILPVPMFVKEPGQTTGAVDDRNAQTIDLVPTVADILGAELPFEVDGVSLLADPDDAPDSKTFVGADGPIDFPETIPDIHELRDVILADFGTTADPVDLFAVGEHRDLVHKPVADLVVAETDGAKGELFDPGKFADLDRTARSLPTFAWGGLDPATAEAGREVAVALNGVVAGIGSTFESEGGLYWAALADPTHLVDGNNEVEIFLIETDGTLRPAELTTD